MTGRTLVVQFHAWRGFGHDGGPLGTVMRIGFASVSWLPFLLTQWIEARMTAIKSAINTK